MRTLIFQISDMLGLLIFRMLFQGFVALGMQEFINLELLGTLEFQDMQSIMYQGLQIFRSCRSLGVGLQVFRVSRYCLLESLAHANIATVADGEMTVMERRQWNSGFCQDFLNSSTWEEPRPQWNSVFQQNMVFLRIFWHQWRHGESIGKRKPGIIGRANNSGALNLNQLVPLVPAGQNKIDQAMSLGNVHI